MLYKNASMANEDSLGIFMTRNRSHHKDALFYSGLANRPFPSCFEPHFESELSAKFLL